MMNIFGIGSKVRIIESGELGTVRGLLLREEKIQYAVSKKGCQNTFIFEVCDIEYPNIPTFKRGDGVSYTKCNHSTDVEFGNIKDIFIFVDRTEYLVETKVDDDDIRIVIVNEENII